MPSLREMRRDRGLSRKDLAEAVGVTPQAISQYESARRVPKYPIAHRLSRELGVPWSQIVDIAHDAKKDRDDVEREVAELRDRLRAVADEAKGSDLLRGLLADLAANEFADVLDVEVDE